ncbi:Hypothetical predicted protein [Mytilus galloprovincialis]|uniref:C1q domain-containing protein n=1 Tax=Mytilus galloprovincialis TaxID=29158 RepID=A0A8B6GB10_MYTGA|nr:Hypothetical predicted protein [Mytilus galloprovincialis]
MSRLWMLLILCSLTYGITVHKSCQTVWKQLESCISGTDIEVKQIQSESIAFSATRTTDITLSSLQTLLFDKVYLNEGGGYNAHTGLFTAPYHGSTHLMLLKNNHEVARGFGSSHDDTGSIVSTVQLKKRDVVRVAVMARKGRDRARGDGWSSITGFRLN